MRHKKYEEENKEKIRIRRKKYREENIDKMRIREKKSRERNKDTRRKYEEENREKFKVRKKEYYKENKNEISDKSKEYYENNKEYIKNKSKKYYDVNSDEMNMKSQQRYENNKKAICIICGNPAHIKYCSDECQGIGMSGENSSRWNGGPKIYSIEWNNKFKKMIRDRDNNKCMRCGRAREEFNRALDVHHIDANPQNTTKENCITLCIPCHNLTKNKGEFFNEGFRNMLKRLYGYVYENENNVDKSKLKIVRKEVK